MLICCAIVFAFSLIKFFVKDSLETKVTGDNWGLFDLDSARFRIPFEKNSLIVHFSTTCSSCQTEANKLASNNAQLRRQHTKVYFVSEESIAAIQQFQRELQLEDSTVISFLKSNDSIFEIFGTAYVPQMFLYSNKKFIKQFKGETKVEAIIQHLPK